MTPEAIRTIAKEIAKTENEPIFKAAADFLKPTYLESIRQAVRSGDFNKAAYMDGRIQGLEDLYYAMRRLAEEGKV